jgi:hypothetical protein
MSTVAELGATCATISKIFFMAGLRPTIFSTFWKSLILSWSMRFSRTRDCFSTALRTSLRISRGLKGFWM